VARPQHAVVDDVERVQAQVADVVVNAGRLRLYGQIFRFDGLGLACQT